MISRPTNNTLIADLNLKCKSINANKLSARGANSVRMISGEKISIYNRINWPSSAARRVNLFPT